jgi:hypothetical protein
LPRTIVATISPGMEGRLGESLIKAQSALEMAGARLAWAKDLIHVLNYVHLGIPEEEQQEVKAKPKRYLSPAARKAIAKAQRERWAKSKALHNKSAKTKVSGVLHWTEADDKRIIQTIKSKGGPVDAPAIARTLQTKFPGRTEGALRQHMNRLAHRGLLKQSKGESKRGIPHMMVEAA